MALFVVYGESISLINIYKMMVEYTRLAWQENEATYQAVLQVSLDYENKIPWYIKDDERKWKKYTNQKSLNVNVSVMEGTMKMERL